MSDVLRQLLERPAPSGARDVPAGVQAALAGDPQAARYAEGALRRACENIAYAVPGTRNHTLNAESWSIGQLVKAGHLEWGEAQGRLWEAGLACGLPEAEIERTVPRAIRQADARDVHLDDSGFNAPDVTFQPKPPDEASQSAGGNPGGGDEAGTGPVPPVEEQREQAAALMHERDVQLELRRLHVQEEARQRYAQQAAADQLGTIPPPTLLTDFLAVDDPPIHWLLEGLQPVGTRALLAAQAKAGKTTMVANLIKALADGAPFLGEFLNHFTGTITLIDDELDDRMLRRWLRNLNIHDTDKVRVVTLRGRLSQFNIVDPQTRHLWAQHLTGTDYIILDCLRPVLDACGLDENREAGVFLNAFDALLEETGIDSALVVHHMGHSASRSRGDSRIMDWPDALWKLTRTDTENPASKRHLSAFGRDVNVPEQPLHYRDGALVLNTPAPASKTFTTPAEWVVETWRLEAAGQSQTKRWWEERAQADRAAGLTTTPSRDVVRSTVNQLVDDGTLSKDQGHGGWGYIPNENSPFVQRLILG